MKGTIGIIQNDDIGQGLTHSYFASVLESFRQECNAQDYNIAFLNSMKAKDNSQSYVDQCKELGYSGVLLACLEENEDVRGLLASDIIVGALDKDYPKCINIISDNVSGMEALMEHLIDLGHRRIAFITGEDCLVTNIRLTTYIEMSKNNLISVNEDYIKQGSYRDIYKTAQLTEELLKLPAPPTCIIFPDDYAAIGGLNIIKARGLEIPRNISVAGFDGNKILSLIEPTLTTVKQDTEKIGQLLAKKIIAAIEDPANIEFGTESVDTILFKGRSTGSVVSF